MRTICMVLGLPWEDTAMQLARIICGIAAIIWFGLVLCLIPVFLHDKYCCRFGRRELLGTENARTEDARIALVRSTVWLEIAQAILAESKNEYHKETAESLLRQIGTNNVALKGML